ncbi:MAG: glucose-1-phosphate cytidylyltransferase [Rhodospirillaceae bacterium]|nr:glucose-1-phosphate cytidylyltransferase [Rhodospirillaceae bacterium]
MKVVLFCGGQGMRLRDYSHDIPKPMVPIGYRPILWHVMKYYAAHGHKDFILCLGYKADYIKDYFLNYKEAISNDFVLSEGGAKLQMLATDIHDWRISFVDTGFSSNIGERLRAVRDHLRGEEMFLANYSDNLTDFPLPRLIERVRHSGKVGGFLAVKPPYSFHLVHFKDDDLVGEIRDFRDTDLWINGGNFVLRQEVFDHMHEGEELVLEPFARLIARDQLIACRYEGFWMAMDTFKEKRALDDLYERDNAPWEIWKDKARQAADRPA